VTVAFEADDHKAYYPGSHKIAMRFTGDRATGRLLGVQLFGHKHAEIAKRIDIAATAIHHGMTIDEVSDLDLSYTPPLGSPWDAVQMGAQAWARHGTSANRTSPDTDPCSESRTCRYRSMRRSGLRRSDLHRSDLRRQESHPQRRASSIRAYRRR
jgi:pyridine nucleotide-disulfide oxidoreductase